ncbi:sensor histidine kinase [Ruminococcus sp. 5_1_39BFAA]|uniref:cache domain-containing sensor histidine kinase n=1 Tax=Ruminococcus sp. 5_1_39BFAA TaxID=457412 RepID=UPI00356A009B
MLRKWKQYLDPDSMMFRMVALNCGILVLVTVVLTAVGNAIYQDSIEEHSFANTMEIQNQVLKSLDLVFQSLSDNMEILGREPDVQSYLEVDDEKEQALRVDFESRVRRLLLRYSENYEDYLSIVIASEKGQYLSNDSFRIKKLPLSREDWYQKAVAADGNLVINSTSFGRNLRSWKNYSTDSYISAAKMVRSSITNEPAGVILVDLDIRSIQNLVEDITMGQTGFGYIQDSQGKVIYTPKNEIVYRMNPEWFQGEESGQVRCKIKGKQYNVIYSHSSYTNLTAVGVFDWGKTIQGVAHVRKASILVAVAIAIFAAICTISFAASITKPISRLSKLMKRAKTGDFTVHFDNPYKGEIHQLGDAFNALVDNINGLLKLVYEEQKKKREAELKILHEQIKPHFLYNTLDTIQWMAKSYHAQDIVDIVLALSNFFRISLSQGKEYITLEQESAMVKSYLDIQKFRYEELFEYETEFDPEIMKCKVLKLSLQPLVENALYHGIKESDLEKGTIWIKGYAEGDTIVLRVEDNGAGMSPEWCEKLNVWLKEKERAEGTEAFGSLNVNDRIKIAYGEEYGLHYELRPGGGVIAEMRIKRMR